jgi:hypothetical protein
VLRKLADQPYCDAGLHNMFMRLIIRWLQKHRL